MNVLHLLERSADYQTRAMAHAIGGDEVRTVHRLGILTAARGLRQCGPIAAIHAWGFSPLAAAALANVAPIIHTPSGQWTSRGVKQLIWISRRRRVHVTCDQGGLRNTLCLRGLAPDRCHVIPPGVNDPDAAPLPPRRQIREQLGLTDEHFVVLAPGESTRAANHRLSLWAMGILHELSPSWKLLAWGIGPMAADLRRTAVRLGCQRMLIFGGGADFAPLTAAADAALVTGDPTAATLPVAICMAAGLPIVGSGSESPRSMAQELIDLRADSAAMKTKGEAARMQARRDFGMDRFRRNLAALYETVVTHPGA